MAEDWMCAQWEAAGPWSVRPQQEVRPSTRNVAATLGKVTSTEDGEGTGSPEVEPVWPGVVREGPVNEGGEDEGLAAAQQTGGAGHAETVRNSGVARRRCRGEVWGGRGEGMQGRSFQALVGRGSETQLVETSGGLVTCTSERPLVTLAAVLDSSALVCVSLTAWTRAKVRQGSCR